MADKEQIAAAAEAYAASFSLTPASHAQVEQAEAVTDAALTRIKEMETLISTTGEEVDSIANELVPQLQKNTEQLTNVFALVDKMHDHIANVKDSVGKMEARLEAAEAANANALTKTLTSFMGGVRKKEAPTDPVHIVSVDEFFSSLKV